MTNYRKLSSIEQSMEILNRRTSSFQVVTTSCITGNLTADVLQKALNLVQLRHPRLQYRIVGELDNLKFANAAIPIPLDVVENLRPDYWQEIVLQELNQKIASDKVLLRAILIIDKSIHNPSYFITTSHHAISDGLSCIQLHSEILNYCQRIAFGDPIDEIMSLPLLPPVTELMPKSMRTLRGKLNNFSYLLGLQIQQLWRRPKTLDIEKYAELESRSCGVVHKRLNQESTTKLIDLCRQEKTTVQGALCAAMLLAVANKINDNNNQSIALSCRSSINLRKYLQPQITNEHMSMLVSSVTSFHTLKPKISFWNLARDARQKIQHSLKTKDIFSQVLLSQKILSFFLARPHKTPTTIVLTNVGKVNIPQDYGQFQLKEISFIPSQAAFGGVFGAAVATFENKMLLNFMYSQPSISKQTIETLANDTISYLLDACSIATDI